MPRPRQVDLAGEETKYGLPPQDLPELLEEALAYRHLQVCGLMVLPPYLEDPDVWEHIINPGTLPNDRTHVFNLYGSYTFVAGMSLALPAAVSGFAMLDYPRLLWAAGLTIGLGVSAVVIGGALRLAYVELDSVGE